MAKMVPGTVKGWVMFAIAVAVAVAVIWRIPQVRSIVTGS